MTEHRIFELGDFALQKGFVLPDARLGYLTLGELNAERDNVVLCPTWFTGVPADTAAVMTGQGRALDPERWFIVVPGHFGGGASSSPSNTAPPWERSRFPRVTTYDNVRAQHRLLVEGLGVERIRLATSWSMGACQVYAWAAAHPDMVEAIAPIAGSARTADYNKVFLAANMSAIRADPAWNDGYYGDRPPVDGVRVMADIYAGWGFREPFYRDRVYRRSAPATCRSCSSSSGRRTSSSATRTTSWRRWRPGGTTTSAPTRLRRRLRRRAGGHHRAGDHPAGGARPLLPAGRLRVRGARDAERRVPPDPGVWGHMAPVEPASQQFIDAALRELLDAG